MKFSDELIADVARTLQIAILTGTDIVDHLRTFEVEDESGLIKLTKDRQRRHSKLLMMFFQNTMNLEIKEKSLMKMIT